MFEKEQTEQTHPGVVGQLHFNHIKAKDPFQHLIATFHQAKALLPYQSRAVSSLGLPFLL
jgi:hypothetical protein